MVDRFSAHNALKRSRRSSSIFTCMIPIVYLYYRDYELSIPLPGRSGPSSFCRRLRNRLL